jgi:hypothetical protein
MATAGRQVQRGKDVTEAWGLIGRLSRGWQASDVCEAGCLFVYLRLALTTRGIFLRIEEKSRFFNNEYSMLITAFSSFSFGWRG